MNDCFAGNVRTVLMSAGCLWISSLVPVMCGAASAQPIPLAISPAEESDPPAPQPLSPEATEFVRGMALLLLPNTISDDDDWGREVRIQSGLHVKRDGLRIDTSRRWKNVNHGVWRRVDATFIDPQKHFLLDIFVLPTTRDQQPGYVIRASVRFHVVGRQQNWSYGAKLMSISAEAEVRVSFEVTLRFRSELISSAGESKLRILPRVDEASVALDGYRLNRISHLKGTIAREFGRSFDELVQRRVARESGRLAEKINRKIVRKPERFEVPIGLMSILGVTDGESRK